MSRSIALSSGAKSARWEHPIMIGVALTELAFLSLGLLSGRPLLGTVAGLSLCYFLVALRNPDAAWALVWLAVPFDVEALLSGGSAITLPTEPMIILALLAWLSRSLLGGKWTLRASPLHIPLLAVSAFVLLSATWSVQPIATLKSWAMMGGYAAFGYLYFFQTRCDRRRRERWLMLVAVTGTVWGLFGIVRVLTLGGAGLEATVASTYAYGAFRPFFSEHGTYGAYLSMLLPATLLAAMERTGGKRLFYVISTLCIGAGIVLAFARAAWLAVVVVVAVTAFLWTRRQRKPGKVALPLAICLAVVLLVGAIGVGRQVGQHAASVVSERNVSNLERLNRWYTAVSIVRERPLIGVGYSCYLDAYRDYRAKTYVTDQTYIRMGVHSEPLKLLCELGVVGFFVVVWFLAAVVKHALQCFRRLPDPGDRMLALAALAGVGTYFINGLFNAYLVESKVTVPFWMGIGVIAALGRRLTSPESPP